MNRMLMINLTGATTRLITTYPRGPYATDAHHGEVRIRELKSAIKSLHDQGFRVIMDVVYNHTWNLDNPLQRTVPYYYYRTWPDSGNLSNGSGCGNDIASERPMVAKYILDSIMYWTREYHLDGFRFDLMGLMTVELMNQIRTQLDDKYGVGEKLIYGEPWAADRTAAPANTPLASKDNFGLIDQNIGMFCDDTRDAIKGSAGDIHATGFVNGADGLEGQIINAVSAWRSNQNIRNAGQIINYVSAHDNQTLWDKLSETTPYEDLRRQQYRLAAGIYLTCQGHPFMLSGESFCRSKGGHTNSHNAPVEINQLKLAAGHRRGRYGQLLPWPNSPTATIAGDCAINQTWLILALAIPGHNRVWSAIWSIIPTTLAAHRGNTCALFTIAMPRGTRN